MKKKGRRVFPRKDFYPKFSFKKEEEEDWKEKEKKKRKIQESYIHRKCPQKF